MSGASLLGREIRQRAAAGQLQTTTAGLAPGFVQANLVILPAASATDFLIFCHRNPKPCPLLDVTEPGCPEPGRVALGADLRTDLPGYRIYRRGELIDEPTDIRRWWRDDSVAVLLGCSFTFERALSEAGIPLRHVESGRIVPMYRTSIPCVPAGPFRGPVVVSMRPMTPAQAIRATQLTSRYTKAHGAPIHWGDPSHLGIRSIAEPDYGEPVEIQPGEQPVFWACGVTPQAVAMEARLELLITHKPGHMFVTDLRDVDTLDA